MNPNGEKDPALSELSGQIERITYFNEQNGYTIARLKVYGRRDLVTVVGHLMGAAPGEILRMRGHWSQHPRFGEQFRIVEYRSAVPATVYGIQKYLGSGLIPGLGPKIAERIVARFGPGTLEVIEEDAERLAEVKGVGQKRLALIRTAWEDQKEIRQVMLFLQTHGVGSGYAAKIFKHYGNGAIAVVTENPYRLATDIFGIGFITADSIAAKLGFAPDCPLRIEAGILYVLHQLAEDGHVYYPSGPLINKSAEILKTDKEGVAEALAVIAAEQKIILEDLNPGPKETADDSKAVFLAKFHLCETSIARRLKLLIDAPKLIRRIDADKALAWVQRHLSLRLAEKQLLAVESALTHKVMIVTGGPGTGKTTIINAILKIYDRLGVAALLAAPTGRAAKRMSETTGHEARTLHRLLEYSITKGGFQRNEQRPLSCDLLIIDEASMIDTILMHHLLKAVPAFATLILVGDVNQLPSVGAGNVLKDIMAAAVVPVVELKEIFRQARQSRIIINAHRINRGVMPLGEGEGTEEFQQDFYFIQQEEPEKVLEIIVRLVKERIPERFGLDPVDGIQVLTPMHRGLVGAGNLNRELQAALNPAAEAIVRGDGQFRVGDKVMQIRNNYDKEVYNGDIGRISRLLAGEQKVDICFDGREILYDFADLDEIQLAYAVSIHKSQGSEYPAVVIPILTQHYILLQRNLIYTAVTRGRQLVVLVGTRKALAIGIKNDQTEKRYTLLRRRLAAA